ncbi:hypothetical protein Ciccas_001832 [Cichlidogyrus casuarinus]|uniref:Uncharacterized protein n=1 Tax=Cichlidogyrus casuarinus TaxID=1844966 RepID=A0ABD2QJ08_9PLAT
MNDNSQSTLVAENRASSILRTAPKKPPTDRDLLTPVWHNYVVMACCIAPSSVSSKIPKISDQVLYRPKQEYTGLSPQDLESDEENTSAKQFKSGPNSAFKSVKENSAAEEEISFKSYHTKSNAKDLLKMLIPLIRCDQVELRETVVAGLGRINPACVRDVLEELSGYLQLVVEKKQENVRRKKRRDNAQCDQLQEFIEGMKVYLETMLDHITPLFCDPSLKASTPNSQVQSMNQPLSVQSSPDQANVAPSNLQVENSPSNDMVVLNNESLATMFQELQQKNPYCKSLSVLANGRPLNETDDGDSQKAAKLWQDIGLWTELVWNANQAMALLLCSNKLDPTDIEFSAGVKFQSLLSLQPGYALRWIEHLLNARDPILSEAPWLWHNPVNFSPMYPVTDELRLMVLALVYLESDSELLVERARTMLQVLYYRFILLPKLPSTPRGTSKDQTRISLLNAETFWCSISHLPPGEINRQFAAQHPELTLSVFSEISLRLENCRPSFRNRLLRFLAPFFINVEMVDLILSASAKNSVRRASRRHHFGTKLQTSISSNLDSKMSSTPSPKHRRTGSSPQTKFLPGKLRKRHVHHTSQELVNEAHPPMRTQNNRASLPPLTSNGHSKLNRRKFCSAEDFTNNAINGDELFVNNGCGDSAGVGSSEQCQFAAATSRRAEVGEWQDHVPKSWSTSESRDSGTGSLVSRAYSVEVRRDGIERCHAAGAEQPVLLHTEV